MAIIISAVSQKGGVGKSTLCRLLAREFVTAGYSAKIIDLDTNQSTCHEWAVERNKNEVEPFIPVQQYPRLEKALETDSAQFDVLLLDGAPNADKNTLKIAQKSDLILVPTGVGKDDIKPAKKLIAELIRKGVPADRISIALCRVTGAAKTTVSNAYHNLIDEGYDVLEGAMRFQAGYVVAFDEGKAATETNHQSLNEEAAAIGDCVVARLKKLQQERAA